jgi:hypothetical protein
VIVYVVSLATEAGWAEHTHEGRVLSLCADPMFADARYAAVTVVGDGHAAVDLPPTSPRVISPRVLARSGAPRGAASLTVDGLLAEWIAVAEADGYSHPGVVGCATPEARARLTGSTMFDGLFVSFPEALAYARAWLEESRRRRASPA